MGKWGPGSPSSRENGDPGSPFYCEDEDPIGKMGTPGPHFTRRMGTRVPIFLVKWGPGSPFYCEDGDPIGKMGTPNVADHFLGIEGSNPALL